MNKMVKNGLFIGVTVIVCIEIIVLHLQLSSLSTLRSVRVEEAKTSYRKVHRLLDEITEIKKKTGGPSLRKGTIGLAEFKKMARESGIDQTPHTRQWPVNTRNKNVSEQRSEIKLFRISADSVFRFLSVLEKTGGSSRINSLNIIRTRGQKNVFDLNVWVSTYTPKTSAGR